jgi:hypothetical protein
MLTARKGVGYTSTQASSTISGGKDSEISYGSGS